MFTANYWRLFFEFALALMMLKSIYYELLYWNEFSINFDRIQFMDGVLEEIIGFNIVIVKNLIYHSLLDFQ